MKGTTVAEWVAGTFDDWFSNPYGIEPGDSLIGSLTSPLRHLDPEQISANSRVESRNREIHLPPISVYRWWARRTESVNGSVIDAVGKDIQGRLHVADPFAGGGVIPLAAIMRNHRVYAQDLNPWATAGLSVMLGLPSATALREASDALEELVADEIDEAYATSLSDETSGHLSHTFRVATARCSQCGELNRMFPYALVSLVARRERKLPDAFLACPAGHIFLGREDSEAKCPICGRHTNPSTSYSRSRMVTCWRCGFVERLEHRAASGTWGWEVVLVERARRGARELAIPTATEIAISEHAKWQPQRKLGRIPAGRETRVLLRHGFTSWCDLYPRRQSAMLERLLNATQNVTDDPAVIRALRMAVVGSCEMAGYLSRWDRFYLKSYEAMAGHRFNFTTFAVEPNVWGTPTSGRGTVKRRLLHLSKAAEWLHMQSGQKISVKGPLPTSSKSIRQEEDVRIVEGSSELMLLPSNSIDLVLTDPPYHDDVQYSELSLPLRAWAGLNSDALVGEAVVNDVTGQLRSAGDYETLLARIFTETCRVMRPSGHLIFSYANRHPEAWVALFSALQQANLQAVGCEVLHSENETDHAKRGVRSCTLDLIMDLVPASKRPAIQHVPNIGDRTAERVFLQIVAKAFLRVGTLASGWEDPFISELRATDFLDSKTKEDDPS